MRRRLAAAAALGVAAGASATQRRRRARASTLPLAGAYELASVWDHGADAAASAPPAQENERQEAGSRKCMRRRMTGLLVYQDDGRMWTQCHEFGDGGATPRCTEYTGRWWVHEGSHGYSPHGTHPLVEHDVRTASDPALVGKTLLQRYALSDGGRRLTTTDVQIVFGRACVVEQLEWRRLSDP